MLFPCVPKTGGCEWESLRYFVSHFNSALGTKYERVKCLDVEERNDRSSTGMPRVASFGN